MSKKSLIIICAITWMILALSMLIPEVSFRVKCDNYIEVTGIIVDTYTMGGDNRVSPPRYYVEVEYANSEDVKSTQRGIKKAINEVEGGYHHFLLR